jgi:CRP/FNR family transcriptional regulator, cyclic AMP receptor protein
MQDVLNWFEGLPEVSFAAGEVMLDEGVRLGKLYVLIGGEVEIVRKGSQVTHVDEPGSIFGEMSVLLDMPHSATVTALSDVDAYVVDNAIAFLEERPQVALHVASLLARRLYYTTSYLVDLQQQAAGKREDLDVIDRILSKLFQEPKGQRKSGRKSV